MSAVLCPLEQCPEWVRLNGIASGLWPGLDGSAEMWDELHLANKAVMQHLRDKEAHETHKKGARA